MMRLSAVLLIVASAWAPGAQPHGNVIETPEMRVTISTKGPKQFTTGVNEYLAVVYLKVENLSDKEVAPDLTKFYLRASSGKALRWLPPDEAAALMFGKTAAMRNALSYGIGGPLRGPGLVRQSEQQGSAAIQQRAFNPGAIPPKTFREGVLYFEGPGVKKKVDLTLFAPGITGRDGVGLMW